MPVTRYTYAMPGVPIAENRGGTVKTYTQDLWGSTALLSDTNGSTTDTFQFDYFGNQISRTGSTATSFRFRSVFFMSGASTRFLYGSEYDTKMAVYLQGPKQVPVKDPIKRPPPRERDPDARFWNDLEPFGNLPKKCIEQCKQILENPDPILDMDPGDPRYWGPHVPPSEPNLRTYLYRLCLTSCLFTERKLYYKLGFAKGAYQIKDCCKVWVIMRHVEAGVYHPWFWLDKNCDGGWVEGEIYGYGPREGYTDPSRPAQDQDMYATYWGQDWLRKATYGVQINCDCRCLAAWWESHFGFENNTASGRLWSPSRYPAIISQDGRDNSIGAVTAAIDVCCPNEQSKLDCHMPSENTAFWTGRARGPRPRVGRGS